MKQSITAEMTVNEAIQRAPDAVRVFKDVGIDSCCGGALPIAEAARRHKLDLMELLNTLNDAPVDAPA